ncbi:MAG TPA: hypothetical protein DDW98_13520 [Gammaproteobacteria bacterium]|nr:hypothetical protein [Gammaproteobacteria bacterium]
MQALRPGFSGSRFRAVSCFLLAGLMAGAHATPLDGTAPAEMARESVRTLLTDIQYTGRRYVAVGWRGHILLSEKARDWRQVQVPVNVLLTAVDFVDELTGWVVGHDSTILKTTDGGDSWDVQSFGAGLPPLLDVLFLDARHGLAVGTYGAMMQTADGGLSWENVHNDIVDEALHFNDLQRLADGTILLVGELGMMAISTDEGRTWRRLSSPYDSSLFSAAPSGDRGAIVGGMRGSLFITDDIHDGQWRPIENPSTQSIFGITQLPDGTGHVLAALNGTLQVIAVDGEISNVALDKESAGIPPVPPSGPPYVFVLTDDVDQELGAFCRALPLKDGFLTVGDSGVRYWH